MFLNWLINNLEVLGTFAAAIGFLIWVKKALGHDVQSLRRDVQTLSDKMNENFNIVHGELKDIKREIQSLDKRHSLRRKI